MLARILHTQIGMEQEKGKSKVRLEAVFVASALAALVGLYLLTLAGMVI